MKKFVFGVILFILSAVMFVYGAKIMESVINVDGVDAIALIILIPLVIGVYLVQLLTCAGTQVLLWMNVKSPFGRAKPVSVVLAILCIVMVLISLCLFSYLLIR